MSNSVNMLKFYEIVINLISCEASEELMILTGKYHPIWLIV